MSGEHNTPDARMEQCFTLATVVNSGGFRPEKYPACYGSPLCAQSVGEAARNLQLAVSSSGLGCGQLNLELSDPYAARLVRKGKGFRLQPRPAKGAQSATLGKTDH
ncbi:hypothetical protein BH20ACI3_BH20ACI3_00100 [soil metagenome]